MRWRTSTFVWRERCRQFSFPLLFICRKTCERNYNLCLTRYQADEGLQGEETGAACVKRMVVKEGSMFLLSSRGEI